MSTGCDRCKTLEALIRRLPDHGFPWSMDEHAAWREAKEFLGGKPFSYLGFDFGSKEDKAVMTEGHFEGDKFIIDKVVELDNVK